MHIIRSNYSNNSIALIQWAANRALADVTVVYIDTGWAGEGWLDYVTVCERFVRSIGFKVKHIQSPMPFADLMEMKGGFPTRRYQWCSLHLKGIPFLNWVDVVDPNCNATVLVARINADQNSESTVDEFNECCEYHGNRRVWHPLYNATFTERDALLKQAGIDPLPHHSRECNPCINSNVADLRRLTEKEIHKTAELEEELETTLFDSQSCAGAKGINKVVAWAKQANDDALDLKYGCSAAFGCGA